MAYVTPRTWAIGDSPTAAMLNQDLRDTLNAFRTPEYTCKLNRTTNQAIGTTTTFSAVTWQAAVWNVGAMWSSGTNPNRITVPLTGIYKLGVNIPWTNNGSGRRAVGWRANGPGTTFNLQIQESTGVDTVNGSEYIQLTAGDYVEIMVFQDSGVSLNVLGGTEQNATVSLRFTGIVTPEPPVWVPPRTWTDGEIMSPAMFNTQLRDEILNLRTMRGAGVSVYLAEDASVGADQRAPISWGAALWQVGGMWSNGSQLAAPVTGLYEVIVNIETEVQAAGGSTQGCGYVVNGSATHHDLQFQEQTSDSHNLSGSDLVPLTAGDYVELYAFQDSGESLSMKGGTADRTRANLVLVAAAA